MFNYSLKIKILLALFLLALFFLALFLVRGHDAKAADLVVVDQIQKVAESLEKYHIKFNAYPDVSDVDVSTIQIITDQGINKNGAIIFFRDRMEWNRKVNLNSQKDSYVFEFVLTEKWDIWGIYSREGAVCNISSGIIMNCKNKPATFLDYFR